MQYIEIEQNKSRAVHLSVSVCNTAKFERKRTMRQLRKEVFGHLKAIYHCYLKARRARLDYKLSK